MVPRHIRSLHSMPYYWGTVLTTISAIAFLFLIVLFTFFACDARHKKQEGVFASVESGDSVQINSVIGRVWRAEEYSISVEYRDSNGVVQIYNTPYDRVYKFKRFMNK